VRSRQRLPQLSWRHPENFAKGVIEDRQILKPDVERDGSDRQPRIAQPAPGFPQPRDADVRMRSRADDALEASDEVKRTHRCQRGQRPQ